MGGNKNVLYAAGIGVGALIVLDLLLPFWLALLIVIGVPVGAYLMLDPSQRRRLRQANNRRRLGS